MSDRGLGEEEARARLAQRGGPEARQQRVAAAVRLEHRVDDRNPVKVRRPLIAPRRGAGEAEGWDRVVPERLSVGLGLDQDDVTGYAGRFEPPEPVGAGLRAPPPPESRGALGASLNRTACSASSASR